MSNFYFAKPGFILLFWLGVFLPQELSFYLGSARLEFYRVVLLFASPFIIYSFAKFPLRRFELLLLLYVMVSIVSFVYHGVYGGLEAAVVIFLEVFVTYQWGRVIILSRGIDALRDTVKLVTLMFFVLAPFAIYENISGHRIFHAVASSLTGIPTEVHVRGDYYRNGIARAGTVFVHPILYSIMAMSIYFVTISMSSNASDRFRSKIGYLIAIVSSMSSVGFLMLALQYGVKVIDKLIRKVAAMKYVLVLFVIFSAFIIQFFSERGLVKWLAVNSALNKWNAYIRIIQWESAVDDVMNNPWLGIGFREWTRPFWLPSSIDSYWLYTAVTNGLLASLLLFTFWIVTMMKVLFRYQETKDRVMLSVFGAIAAIIFAGFTVHFFDKAPVFLYFLLGSYIGYYFKKLEPN